MEPSVQPGPPPSSTLQPVAPRRILVRGVNWLGDTVMTTPALLRLRERFPAAYVALLTPEKLKDLALHHPVINETIGFAPRESLFAVSRKLSRGRFDCALILPNSPRSALETWLARIPQRIGYARPWRNAFLTRTIEPRPGAGQMKKRSVAEIKQIIRSPTPTTHNSQLVTRNSSAHQIHEYLHLVARAFGANTEPLPPQLFVQPQEIDAVRRKFGLLETAAPVFGMNPGAEYGPAKRWPVDRFIAAAREIQKRTHCVWLILGARGDLEIAGRIESAINSQLSTLNSQLSKPRNLTGQTSLRELCALLKLCRVLLTNDTGAMHVAAALDTPVVVPFGSTSPELTGPGLPGNRNHRLLTSEAPCSPCFLRKCPIDFRCMTGISVENVVNAVVELSAR